VSGLDRFAIPGDLREPAQWVVWRRELRDGNETKVPYRAASPATRASTTDPRTWASFGRALDVFERGKADGLGFVFCERDPFTGVDLDHCRDEGGELHPTAAALIGELDSYCEWSPSGQGVHVIVRARLEGTVAAAGQSRSTTAAAISP
jgi:putative DNA primase/helicase